MHPSEPVRGPIPISASLRALLARLREARGAPAHEAALDRGAVLDAERELGSVIPDAVLALLAAIGRTPAALVDETALLHDYAQSFEPPARSTARLAIRGLVALDHWGEWPVSSLVYAKSDDRSLDRFATWDWKRWVRLPGAETDLAAFVRFRYGGLGADGEPLDLDRPPSRDALDGFAPALVTPEPPPERWVRHPKLGVARVVRELGDKTEIQLESGAIKVFLTRALEPIER